LFLSIFSTYLGDHHEDGGHGTCCNKKLLNNKEYKLVESGGNTGRYGCISDCIYEEVEDPGQKFCFGLGDYMPECLDVNYWGYGEHNGPDTWPSTFPEFCSGSNQSPIDFLSYDIPTSDPDPGQITLINYDVHMPGELTNNGHTLGFSFTGEGIKPTITGGRLGDRVYEFLQLHWHWGSDDSQGSEHRVDGQMFPMELHMVHINTAYGDEWPLHSDGAAVLGFFYEVSTEDNANLWDLLDGLATMKSLTNKKSASDNGRAEVFNVAVPTDISLNDMMNVGGPGSEYFYYSGGLTTPACNEIVEWTVFLEKVPISATQLQIFRGLVDSHGTSLNNNYRPPQPINGRPVWKRATGIP